MNYSTIFILQFCNGSFNLIICSQMKHKNTSAVYEKDGLNNIVGGTGHRFREVNQVGPSNTNVANDNETRKFNPNFHEFIWNFYLINYRGEDLLKIDYNNLNEIFIIYYDPVVKLGEDKNVINMKKLYPSAEWKDSNENYVRLRSRIIIDLNKKDSKFEISYSDPNYQIKISRILKKKKEQLNWAFESFETDGCIDLSSIYSESDDIICFLELVNSSSKKTSKSGSFQSKNEGQVENVETQNILDDVYDEQESIILLNIENILNDEKQEIKKTNDDCIAEEVNFCNNLLNTDNEIGFKERNKEKQSISTFEASGCYLNKANYLSDKKVYREYFEEETKKDPQSKIEQENKKRKRFAKLKNKHSLNNNIHEKSMLENPVEGPRLFSEVLKLTSTLNNRKMGTIYQDEKPKKTTSKNN